VYVWNDVVANPKDARNLVICGARTTKRGLFYWESFVLASFDGGRAWRETLVDGSTPWVSEQSCAFTSNGDVYFNSEASKWFAGKAHHDFGQLHLFKSIDGGRTWQSPWIRPWFDHTAMTASPDGRRLYLFANSPLGNLPQPRGSLPALIVLDETRRLLPPVVPNQPPPDVLASYPNAARATDSTVVAVGFGETYDDRGGRQGTIFSVRSTDAGRSLSDLRILSHESGCSYGATLDADRSAKWRGRLYAVWPVHGKATSFYDCSLKLAVSDDGGASWTQKTLPESFTGYGPMVAVDGNGRLAIAWKRTQDDCVNFAWSLDGGDSFAKPVVVGAPCLPFDPSDDFYYDGLLLPGALAIPPPGHVYPPHGPRDEPVWGISLRVQASPGARETMAAAADGTFHFAWSAAGAGRGKLMTASVSLDPLKISAGEAHIVGTRVTTAAARRPASPSAPATVVRFSGSTRDLRKVSSAMAVEFEASSYDAKKGTATMTLHLVNSGPLALAAPFVFQIDDAWSGGGTLTALNGLPFQGKPVLLDLSAAVSGGVLRPDGRSRAVRLVFQIAKSTPATGLNSWTLATAGGEFFARTCMPGDVMQCHSSSAR